MVAGVEGVVVRLGKGFFEVIVEEGRYAVRITELVGNGITA